MLTDLRRNLTPDAEFWMDSNPFQSAFISNTFLQETAAILLIEASYFVANLTFVSMLTDLKRNLTPDAEFWMDSNPFHRHLSVFYRRQYLFCIFKCSLHDSCKMDLLIEAAIIYCLYQKVPSESKPVSQGFMIDYKV